MSQNLFVRVIRHLSSMKGNLPFGKSVITSTKNRHPNFRIYQSGIVREKCSTSHGSLLAINRNSKNQYLSSNHVQKLIKSNVTTHAPQHAADRQHKEHMSIRKLSKALASVRTDPKYTIDDFNKISPILKHRILMHIRKYEELANIQGQVMTINNDFKQTLQEALKLFPFDKSLQSKIYRILNKIPENQKNYKVISGTVPSVSSGRLYRKKHDCKSEKQIESSKESSNSSPKPIRNSQSLKTFDSPKGSYKAQSEIKLKTNNSKTSKPVSVKQKKDFKRTEENVRNLNVEKSIRSKSTKNASPYQKLMLQEKYKQYCTDQEEQRPDNEELTESNNIPKFIKIGRFAFGRDLMRSDEHRKVQNSPIRMQRKDETDVETNNDLCSQKSFYRKLHSNLPKPFSIQDSSTPNCEHKKCNLIKIRMYQRSQSQEKPHTIDKPSSTQEIFNLRFNKQRTKNKILKVCSTPSLELMNKPKFQSKEIKEEKPIIPRSAVFDTILQQRNLSTKKHVKSSVLSEDAISDSIQKISESSAIKKALNIDGMLLDTHNKTKALQEVLEESKSKKYIENTYSSKESLLVYKKKKSNSKPSQIHNSETLQLKSNISPSESNSSQKTTDSKKHEVKTSKISTPIKEDETSSATAKVFQGTNRFFKNIFLSHRKPVWEYESIFQKKRELSPNCRRFQSLDSRYTKTEANFSLKDNEVTREGTSNRNFESSKMLKPHRDRDCIETDRFHSTKHDSKEYRTSTTSLAGSGIDRQTQQNSPSIENRFSSQRNPIREQPNLPNRLDPMDGTKANNYNLSFSDRLRIEQQLASAKTAKHFKNTPAPSGKVDQPNFPTSDKNLSNSHPKKGISKALERLMQNHDSHSEFLNARSRAIKYNIEKPSISKTEVKLDHSKYTRNVKIADQAIQANWVRDQKATYRSSNNINRKSETETVVNSSQRRNDFSQDDTSMTNTLLKSRNKITRKYSSSSINISTSKPDTAKNLRKFLSNSMQSRSPPGVSRTTSDKNLCKRNNYKLLSASTSKLDVVTNLTLLNKRYPMNAETNPKKLDNVLDSNNQKHISKHEPEQRTFGEPILMPQFVTTSIEQRARKGNSTPLTTFPSWHLKRISSETLNNRNNSDNIRDNIHGIRNLNQSSVRNFDSMPRNANSIRLQEKPSKAALKNKVSSSSLTSIPQQLTKDRTGMGGFKDTTDINSMNVEKAFLKSKPTPATLKIGKSNTLSRRSSSHSYIKEKKAMNVSDDGAHFQDIKKYPLIQSSYSRESRFKLPSLIDYLKHVREREPTNNVPSPNIHDDHCRFKNTNLRKELLLQASATNKASIKSVKSLTSLITPDIPVKEHSPIDERSKAYTSEQFTRVFPQKSKSLDRARFLTKTTRKLSTDLPPDPNQFQKCPRHSKMPSNSAADYSNKKLTHEEIPSQLSSLDPKMLDLRCLTKPRERASSMSGSQRKVPLLNISTETHNKVRKFDRSETPDITRIMNCAVHSLQCAKNAERHARARSQPLYRSQHFFPDYFAGNDYKSRYQFGQTSTICTHTANQQSSTGPYNWRSHASIPLPYETNSKTLETKTYHSRDLLMHSDPKDCKKYQQCAHEKSLNSSVRTHHEHQDNSNSILNRLDRAYSSFVAYNNDSGTETRRHHCEIHGKRDEKYPWMQKSNVGGTSNSFSECSPLSSFNSTSYPDFDLTKLKTSIRSEKSADAYEQEPISLNNLDSFHEKFKKSYQSYSDFVRSKSNTPILNKKLRSSNWAETSPEKLNSRTHSHLAQSTDQSQYSHSSERIRSSSLPQYSYRTKLNKPLLKDYSQPTSDFHRHLENSTQKLTLARMVPADCNHFNSADQKAMQSTRNAEGTRQDVNQMSNDNQLRLRSYPSRPERNGYFDSKKF